MSLNGLDDATIKEAYDAAVLEPASWFMLKYLSRDEVDLFDKGNAGLEELRNAIAKHQDTTPLFGFLKYRRRHVILKYMPEGCSRLAQARATVHFNAVCERFAPYHTVYEFSDPKELKESKLSAVCSKHAASGSASSSTSSLRRRRLVEIEEEEEEQQQKVKRQSTVKEDTEAEILPQPSEPQVVLNSDLATSPEAVAFSDATIPIQFAGSERPDTASRSFDIRPIPRSYTSNLQSSSASVHSKTHVRLGPRPSHDASGNPRRSVDGFRPVAALPAGLKIHTRGTGKLDTPEHKFERDQTPVTVDVASIPFLTTTTSTPVRPFLPLRPQTSVERPSTSSGISVRSLPGIPTKGAKMTKEKARLMKAMQLREKKRQDAAALATQSVEQTPGVIQEESKADDQNTILGVNEADVTKSPKESSPSISIEHAQTIDLESSAESCQPTSAQLDQVSVDTQSDSTPASPVAPSSEVGDSTQASSVSGVPDEEIEHDKGEILAGDDSTEASTVTLEPMQDALSDEHDATVSRAPTSGVQASGRPDNANVYPAIQKSDLKSLPHSVVEAKAAPPAEPAVDGLAKSEPDTISETELVEPPKLQVPLSKYSTIDVDAPQAARAAVIPTVSLPPAAETSTDTPGQTRESRDDPVSSTIQSSTLDEDVDGVTESDADTDDSRHLFDDEDFMDELQSAVVEEAQPVNVGRSASDAGSFLSQHSTPRIIRTASSPIKNGFLSADPVHVQPRSASSGAVFLQKISRASSPSLAAPVQVSRVGSSISQRIKALERLSASNSNVVDAPKERPSSTFFAVRKSSNTHQPGRSSTLPDPFGRGITPSPPASRESAHGLASAPPRERSTSVSRRLTTFEGADGQLRQQDSVQVTARIVRDPLLSQNRMSQLRTLSDDSASSQLKQSTLVVKRQSRAAPDPEARIGDKEASDSEILPNEKRQSSRFNLVSKFRSNKNEDAIQDDGQSITSQKRRSSMSKVRDLTHERRNSTGNKSAISGLMSPPPSAGLKLSSRPPSVHHNGSFASIVTASLKRSSVSADRPHEIATPSTTGSPTSEDFGKEDVSQVLSGNHKSSESLKKRFMRRLSTLNGGRTKASPAHDISDPLEEESVPEIQASQPVPPQANGSGGSSIVSYLGDVNVQFPDNLLWKRRNLCIDSQGFLLLSALGQGRGGLPQSGGTNAAATRRYHLNEFLKPYVPDVEIQELPNSVCLDFVDGSSLQVACEDRAGQVAVLQALTSAYTSHVSMR